MKDLRIIVMIIGSFFLLSIAAKGQNQLELNPYTGYWTLDDLDDGETVYGLSLSMIKPVARILGLRMGVDYGQTRSFQLNGFKSGYNMLDFYGGISLHTKKDLRGLYLELLFRTGFTEVILKDESNKVSDNFFKLGAGMGLGYRFVVSERLYAGFNTSLNVFALDLDNPGYELRGGITFGYRF